MCSSASDDINIRQSKTTERGGAQEHNQEVWAGSARIQCVGSYEAGQWVCFSASDDINIIQHSVIAVFLHLMILTYNIQ